MFFTILFIGNFEKLQKFKSTGNVLETSWNFMRCPPENECLNNHHSCDPVTQVCIDTLEGFECKCNDGKLCILLIYRNFGPANDVGRVSNSLSVHSVNLFKLIKSNFILETEAKRI